MTLNICTRVRENILDGIKVIERTRFSTKKIQRGIFSFKKKGGVMVLLLCTSSDDILYLYQVS